MWIKFPDQTGHYWFRKNKYKATVLYYVWHDHGSSYCRRSAREIFEKELVEEVNGEWYGPINPQE